MGPREEEKKQERLEFLLLASDVVDPTSDRYLSIIRELRKLQQELGPEQDEEEEWETR